MCWRGSWSIVYASAAGRLDARAAEREHAAIARQIRKALFPTRAAR
jgi:hypothetical protein